MICLPSQLPLLRFGNFEVVQYDARWLEDSITAAAERAGHEDWWVAGDIAKGIIEYLRLRYPSNTISVEELYGKKWIVHGLLFRGESDSIKVSQYIRPAKGIKGSEYKYVINPDLLRPKFYKPSGGF